jgi:hypothetical protein
MIFGQSFGIVFRRQRGLRVQSLHPAVQLVQRVDVGLGRRGDDVRVGTDTVDDAAGARQPHRDLALRIGAGGDRIDRKQHEFGAAVDLAFDRPQRCIDRAVAIGLR